MSTTIEKISHPINITNKKMMHDNSIEYMIRNNKNIHNLTGAHHLISSFSTFMKSQLNLLKNIS
jgi:hypothetical protein